MAQDLGVRERAAHWGERVRSIRRDSTTTLRVLSTTGAISRELHRHAPSFAPEPAGVLDEIERINAR